MGRACSDIGGQSEHGRQHHGRFEGSDVGEGGESRAGDDHDGCHSKSWVASGVRCAKCASLGTPLTPARIRSRPNIKRPHDLVSLRRARHDRDRARISLGGRSDRRAIQRRRRGRERPRRVHHTTSTRSSGPSGPERRAVEFGPSPDAGAELCAARSAGARRPAQQLVS